MYPQLRDSLKLLNLLLFSELLKKCSVSLNLVTDSAYVAGIVMRAEASALKESVNKLQADDGFDRLNQFLRDLELNG